MTKDEIYAHAEALANMASDNPSESDFLSAERTVRTNLDNGMSYDNDKGWN